MIGSQNRYLHMLYSVVKVEKLGLPGQEAVLRCAGLKKPAFMATFAGRLVEIGQPLLRALFLSFSRLLN